MASTRRKKSSAVKRTSSRKGGGSKKAAKNMKSDSRLRTDICSCFCWLFLCCFCSAISGWWVLPAIFSVLFLWTFRAAGICFPDSSVSRGRFLPCQPAQPPASQKNDRGSRPFLHELCTDPSADRGIFRKRYGSAAFFPGARRSFWRRPAGWGSYPAALPIFGTAGTYVIVLALLAVFAIITTQKPLLAKPGKKALRRISRPESIMRRRKNAEKNGARSRSWRRFPETASSRSRHFRISLSKETI